MLISDGYRQQLREMAEDGVWGGGGAGSAKHAMKLVGHFGAKSVLDYGCGPGSFKKALACNDASLSIREYDPGIVGKDALPEPADLVVCIDVMEHIEPEFVGNVLSHIHSLTLKAALFVISLRPAEKRLPDGRNAHLTIDNAAWWYQQLAKLEWSVNHLPIKRRPDIGRFVTVKA